MKGRKKWRKNEELGGGVGLRTPPWGPLEVVGVAVPDPASESSLPWTHPVLLPAFINHEKIIKS
jgi:hypothetical protein